MDHGKKHRCAPIIAILALFAISAFCEPDSAGVSPQLFGMGSYEFGEIVKGQYAWAKQPKGRLDHYWNQQLLMQLGFDAKRSNGFNVVLAGECALYFPYSLPSDGSGFGFVLLGPQFKFYVHHAEGMYTLGNPENLMLQVGAGFFPFKYNPDARNFGDYMFRINSYPQYLPTHFDAPYERLLGLHINGTAFSSLKMDFLVTSEVYLWPLRDLSLSYLIGYDLFGFADIGAGVMGHRMFSVDEYLTTPPPEAQVPAGTNFSFASTKYMARVALDFKRLIPLDIFGKNDLRLYSEACLNGWTDYPVNDSLNPNFPGYNDKLKRLPVLLGFNVPTFKFLDVLSIEAEWWNNDFANAYWGAYPTGGGYAENPNPWKYSSSVSQGHRMDPYGGAWHWSVYAKKTLFNTLKVVFQAARDHTILETTLTGTSNGDPEEAMDGLGNWGWMCKLEYGF